MPAEKDDIEAVGGRHEESKSSPSSLGEKNANEPRQLSVAENRDRRLSEAMEKNLAGALKNPWPESPKTN